jgi:hypothetical protein
VKVRGVVVVVVIREEEGGSRWEAVRMVWLGVRERSTAIIWDVDLVGEVRGLLGGPVWRHKGIWSGSGRVRRGVGAKLEIRAVEVGEEGTFMGGGMLFKPIGGRVCRGGSMDSRSISSSSSSRYGIGNIGIDKGLVRREHYIEVRGMVIARRMEGVDDFFGRDRRARGRGLRRRGLFRGGNRVEIVIH